MEHCAWIYILTNKYNTTLYIGVTNNLSSLLYEHQTKQDPKSFTARYNIFKLVYFEGFASIVEAIDREKYLKGKSRNWKFERIKTTNPMMEDLSAQWLKLNS
jgi:putative endonuclease